MPTVLDAERAVEYSDSLARQGGRRACAARRARAARRAVSVFCLCMVAVAACRPGAVTPADGTTVHTTHVLFEFDATPAAKAYQLQVAEARADADPFDTPVVDVTVRGPRAVVKSGLAFGEGAPRRYVWRVRAATDDGDRRDVSPVHHFSVAALDADVPGFELLLDEPSAYQPGLTLFSGNRKGSDSFTLAVDETGRVVWFLRWERPVQDLRQLDNGDMLAVIGRRATRFTLAGRVVWRTPAGYAVHHEAYPMPGGHVLCVVRDRRTVSRDGDEQLWRGDKVVEFDCTGRVVWNWVAFDHLSTMDFDATEMSAPNGRGEYDWTHTNACVYEPSDDAVYVSLRHLSRIVKLDHATGRTVWSMGFAMPSGEADFGDDLFSFQHAPQILPGGNILLYDNGNRRGHTVRTRRTGVSRAVEIALDNPESPESAAIVWSYTPPVYTGSLGDADRLANGNTLVCAGERGHIVEVDASGAEVWHIRFESLVPPFKVDRAERVATLYPSTAAGRSLDP